MQNFQTNVRWDGSLPSIEPADNMVWLGSCFANNIGCRLLKLHFSCQVNPTGILYNPLVIGHHLQMALAGGTVVDSHLIEHEDLWHSLLHHSNFSEMQRETLIQNVSSSFARLESALKRARLLVVTFGTAHAYRHQQTGMLVANCHKLPASQFVKELTPIEHITTMWGDIIRLLLSVNDSLQIILTVSPVRYVRDGLISSNRSKAVLITAVHQLADEWEQCSYFPAYELVIDQLRDYRFYSSDMVHPNEQALSFVTDFFVEHAFSDQGRMFFQDMLSLSRDLEHKPLHSQTPSHQKFLRRLLEQIRQLEQRYAHIDLLEEESKVRQQLFTSAGQHLDPTKES